MKLLITKKAAKELDRISDPIAKNITNKILNLQSVPHPSNSKKLQGKNIYRLRIGSFRIIYTINKTRQELTILRVADRKTIYR